MPATTPHRLRSTHNALDSIGFVSTDERGVSFYRIASATGPVEPMFEDLGELTPGTELKLPFNYETDEYASQFGGWPCLVVRINRKSVTVAALVTVRAGVARAAAPRTYRIEL